MLKIETDNGIMYVNPLVIDHVLPYYDDPENFSVISYSRKKYTYLVSEPAEALANRIAELLLKR